MRTLKACSLVLSASWWTTRSGNRIFSGGKAPDTPDFNTQTHTVNPYHHLSHLHACTLLYSEPRTTHFNSPRRQSMVVLQRKTWICYKAYVINFPGSWIIDFLIIYWTCYAKQTSRPGLYLVVWILFQSASKSNGQNPIAEPRKRLNCNKPRSMISDTLVRNLISVLDLVLICVLDGE